MSAHGRVLPETTNPNASERDEIVRFHLSERQMHWAVAIPFMVCYATAAVLILFYNPHPQRPYRAVLSWIHRGSGVALFALPVITFIQHWRDFRLHRRNVGDVWKWTLADIKWLLLIGPSTVNKNIVLPEQGKFNAAEKINFMVLIGSWPLYVCSGLLIWYHQYVFVAWVMHLSLAAAATTLLFGHIFMATVNPDTRVGLSGMVTGLVDRHWAWHHYGGWYKEHYGDLHAPAHGSTGGSAIDPGASAAVFDASALVATHNDLALGSSAEAQGSSTLRERLYGSSSGGVTPGTPAGHEHRHGVSARDARDARDARGRADDIDAADVAAEVDSALNAARSHRGDDPANPGIPPFRVSRSAGY
ncbi:MAG: cytochrome b/b6 domain-containing protein [Acidobacteriota bacterium]